MSVLSHFRKAVQLPGAGAEALSFLPEAALSGTVPQTLQSILEPSPQPRAMGPLEPAAVRQGSCASVTLHWGTPEILGSPEGLGYFTSQSPQLLI